MRLQVNDLGWDTTKNSGYRDILKPKITFDEILRELPKDYRKDELRKMVQDKDLMKVIAEATPQSEFDRKVLGTLTSICAEINHKLTIWRKLDYVGNKLEGGVITIMRAPGKRYATGEYTGYKMIGGLIRVNGRTRSIGPVLGGTIWVNEVDKLVNPMRADIYFKNRPELQSFYHQEKYGRGKMLDKLLQEADNYDWSSVKDISTNKTEKEEHLRSFKEVIENSGIKLEGSILEFDAGRVSIGHLYRDVVAMDSDPKNVKHLRQEGVKTITGTIDKAPIERKSFDYVVAFNPLIARPETGWRWLDKGLGEFEIIGSDYKEKIIKRAIEIARKKVLIVSVDITLTPPYKGKIGRRTQGPYYYVIYNARRDRQ